MGKRVEVSSRYRALIPESLLNFQYISDTAKELLGFFIKEGFENYVELDKKELASSFEVNRYLITSALRELFEIGVILVIGLDNRNVVSVKLMREGIELKK